MAVAISFSVFCFIIYLSSSPDFSQRPQRFRSARSVKFFPQRPPREILSFFLQCPPREI
jgi:hypothetical protein